MESMVMNKLFGGVFSDKKVVITGDTGFKGAWLTLWLTEMGAHVTGVSIDIPTEPALFRVLQLEKRIRHIEADIRDLALMQQIIREEEPDFLFHLAAQPIVSRSYSDPIETMQTNVMGTLHILEALRQYDKKCTAVFITSDKCYDNVEWIWGYKESDHLGGKDPYSASKGAAELMIKTYVHSYFSKWDSKIKLCSVRAGNVIGGGDWAENRIVPDCVRAWSEQQTVEIRNPNATRPWQHVLEPLSGYLLAAQALFESKNSIHGEPFNFGPDADQNKTVEELIKRLTYYWNESAEQLYRVTGDIQFHEAGLLKLNCDKALYYLHWKPILVFEETALFTSKWYKAYYEGTEDMFLFSKAQLESYVELANKRKAAWRS
jgi:CDP-glucose 4,6-dehydratase